MYPFPFYQPPQQPFRGRGRGRGNFRRGRGRSGANSNNQRFNQKEEIAAPPPLEKKEESKEVKEVTRTTPGISLTSCEVQLSISNRQLGFLTQELFLLLLRNAVAVACTPFQLYRILLYAVAVKLANQTKRSVPWVRLPETRPIILERIQSALETDLRLPKPFVDYLNSIGSFELNSVNYSCFIPTFNGPHPLYITIDNLWGTVLALADPATPLMARNLFYINNSLPNAQWNDPAVDPILANPNDYMNAAYDMNVFENDLEAINSLNTALRKKKWPTLAAEKVDFTKTGDSALLASSSLMDSVVRCANNIEGQIVEGNRTDFCLTAPGASPAHAFKGACNLYSEVVRVAGAVPIYDNNRAPGFFQMRVDWRSELRKLFTTG